MGSQMDWEHLDGALLRYTASDDDVYQVTVVAQTALGDRPDGKLVEAEFTLLRFDSDGEVFKVAEGTAERYEEGDRAKALAGVLEDAQEMGVYRLLNELVLRGLELPEWIDAEIIDGQVVWLEDDRAQYNQYSGDRWAELVEQCDYLLEQFRGVQNWLANERHLVFWCMTEDHDEDWFVTAPHCYAAKVAFAMLEGYDTEAVEVFACGVLKPGTYETRYSTEAELASVGIVEVAAEVTGDPEFLRYMGQGGRLMRQGDRLFVEGTLADNRKLFVLPPDVAELVW